MSGIATFPTTRPVNRSDMRQNALMRLHSFEMKRNLMNPELVAIVDRVKKNYDADVKRYGNGSMSIALPFRLVGDALRFTDCTVRTWQRMPTTKWHNVAPVVSHSELRRDKSLRPRPKG